MSLESIHVVSVIDVQAARGEFAALGQTAHQPD